MKDYSSDFPLLKRKYDDHQLVYFDNAATAIKPQIVIDAVLDYYIKHNANVHRGPNFLSEEATNLYEGARIKIANFINAQPEEIIFTSGATAGFNLMARAWGENNLQAGDVVVLSKAEHHANIVPWLQLKEKIGIIVKYIDLDDEGNLNFESFKKIVDSGRVRLLSITQISNVLGLYYDLKRILEITKQNNIVSIVDVSQSIVHKPLDAHNLGADFLVFSGHKLFAPSGLGVLYGRKNLLESMPVFLGGGSMISFVREQSFGLNDSPYKFEAGTPSIEAVIGLGAACDYLREISWSVIQNKEQGLVDYFLMQLDKYQWIKLLGERESRVPLFSLVLDKVHAHDACDLLGEQGIIVRAGHHCAEPLHKYLGVVASLRVSLSFYNTKAEIDKFFKVLDSIYKSFN